MASSPHAGYQLSCAGVHSEQLLRWGEAAKRAGVLPFYLDALDDMTTKLRTAPLDWGEPLFIYRRLHLHVRHAANELLHVYYAVDDLRQIVYIKSFQLMPGHPLCDND